MCVNETVNCGNWKAKAKEKEKTRSRKERAQEQQSGNIILTDFLQYIHDEPVSFSQDSQIFLIFRHSRKKNTKFSFSYTHIFSSPPALVVVLLVLLTHTVQYTYKYIYVYDPRSKFTEIRSYSHRHFGRSTKKKYKKITIQL